MAAEVKLYMSAAQSINHNTATAVSFDMEDDPDGMHSGGAPTRVTITQSGHYWVHMTGRWQAGSDYTSVQHSLRVNGTDTLTSASASKLPPGGAFDPQVLAGGVSMGFGGTLSGATLAGLGVGDYFEVMVTQANQAAAARTLNASLWAVRLAPPSGRPYATLIPEPQWA